MKSLKLLFVTGFFFGCYTAMAGVSKEAPNRYLIEYKADQDTLIQYLSTLNLLQFAGLPIDTFLARIPSNYDSVKILTGDQMKKASKLYLKYNNGVIVAIYVKEFHFMNPDPPRSNWTVTLFRKEDIDRIEIFQGVTCLNGCND